MTENVLLGMQGWHHAKWIGQSYPVDVTSASMLELYSQRFPTVEVDDTFYGIPPEPLVRRWRNSVTTGFSFAVKAPQQVTHEQRFKVGGGLLTRFLDRVSLLEENLGPILFLAPPAFAPDGGNRAELRKFIEGLPTGFRWALELRHSDWFTSELHDLLADNNVACVFGENRWISRSSMLDLTMRPTADFAYVRWNSRSVAAPQVELADRDEHVTAVWVKTLERLSSQVNVVYGYFNINAFGDGLRSAEELQYTIGQQWLEASVSREATTPVDRGAS